MRRLLPFCFLLAACTTQREWQNVASTIGSGAIRDGRQASRLAKLPTGPGDCRLQGFCPTIPKGSKKREP
jgi:hypothetical protein